MDSARPQSQSQPQIQLKPYRTRQWAGCASCGCLIIREDPTRIWSHAANRKGDGTDCHNLVVEPYLTQQQVEQLQAEAGRG